jgi:hypothetical protein
MKRLSQIFVLAFAAMLLSGTNMENASPGRWQCSRTK